MKPKRIFLVRHGESEGNINKALYGQVPEWKIHLTEKGKKQAEGAAVELFDQISLKGVYIYCSPFIRARETAEPLLKLFPWAQYREDPRIREQEWGNFRDPGIALKIEKERYKFGTFFYRMSDGESGADVYDRVSTFLESLHRDFEKKTYPKDVIIVTHGLTIRLFIMRWFHWTVEEYEDLRNPKNCEIFKMELNKKTNKYELKSQFRRRSDRKKES